MENHSSIFKGIHGDLTEFVDRISTVLDCPVTLEDANHRLLAYSIHDDLSDPVRITTIVSRRVPEKVINSFWKEGIMPSLLKYDSPIIISSNHELELGRRAAISIRKNQEVIGFIWALEASRTFTDEDLHFLKVAAKEGKNQLLQVQGKKKRHQESNQEFLWQLLTGHFDSDEEINTICAEQSISLPTSFSVVIFTFPTIIDHSIERNISYMLSTTQKIKSALYTIDQKRLILIAGPSEKNDFIQALSSFISSFISGMHARFDIEGIQGSCGQPYSMYTAARTSYQEAIYTLTLQTIFPDKKEQLLNYASLGIYQYMKILSENKTNNSFKKSIEKLKEYDQKNHSNLKYTLKTYLENDANPYSTANKLHLHVNTIHYRLKRIAEIGYLDLKDPLQKMSLYLEFLLEDYKQFKTFRKNDTFS